jgi:cyclase
MLKKRLIARLDIKAPNLVKTRQMEGLRKLGDPYEKATTYDQQGIDEIIYMDIVASLYGRNSLGGLVRQTTGSVFCPVTVGGGISSVEDALALFGSGADKLALNTAATKRPELITELAMKFGSQAVVIQIDAKRNGENWEVWCDGAREPTGKDVIEWAVEATARGAGEILLTSIDQEGTAKGCDRSLIRAVSSVTTVPLVASGGVGSGDDVAAAYEAGAAGVAMAHVLHYETETLQSIRETAINNGHEVRVRA